MFEENNVENFFKNHIKNFIKKRMNLPFGIICVWVENTNYLVIVESNGKNSLIDITTDINEIYLNIFIQLMIDIESKYNINYELFIMAIFNYYHLNNSEDHIAKNQMSNYLFVIDDKVLFRQCIFNQEFLSKYEIKISPNDEIIELFYNQINKCYKDAKECLFIKYYLPYILGYR